MAAGLLGWCTMTLGLLVSKAITELDKGDENGASSNTTKLAVFISMQTFFFNKRFLDCCKLLANLPLFSLLLCKMGFSEALTPYFPLMSSPVNSEKEF